ncbi:hypothetical protein ALC62_00035, partial [Cyphomyrmex costatus]
FACTHCIFLSPQNATPGFMEDLLEHCPLLHFLFPKDCCCEKDKSCCPKTTTTTTTTTAATTTTTPTTTTPTTVA